MLWFLYPFHQKLVYLLQETVAFIFQCFCEGNEVCDHLTEGLDLHDHNLKTDDEVDVSKSQNSNNYGFSNLNIQMVLLENLFTSKMAIYFSFSKTKTNSFDMHLRILILFK